MMVSPVLGPAMVNLNIYHKNSKNGTLILNDQPFHDAPDEDLEMPENRATQSSSFGMVMVNTRNRRDHR
jgi:hypothetical protein